MKENKIKILPQNVSNLIAAGEVIERPASALKELIENSIDAHASNIDININNTGFEMIKVSDDGDGIEPEDALIAFSRHATSKIKYADDLLNINTFGFRGEALAAIAAVSKIEFITKPAHQSLGIKLLIKAGQLIQKDKIASANGTSITIQDLFYNTPVRKKFMKTSKTEQAHLIEVVELAAISNPSIRFKLSIDKKEIFTYYPNSSLEQRIIAVLKSSLPKNMQFIEIQQSDLYIKAMFSHPNDHRPNRLGIHFFVNKRPVENKTLISALLSAYRPLIPEKRFPTCVIFLEIPSNLIDVNIHPAKREIKFQNERIIYETLFSAISTSLKKSDIINMQKIINKDQSYHYQDNIILDRPFNTGNELVGKYFNEGEAETLKIIDHDYNLNNNIQILGQIGRTYIAGQDENGFFIIDQHAAHERLLYDEYKKWPDDVSCQQLLIPITFELLPSQVEIVEERISEFKRLGFEISFFGKNSFSIYTKPADFNGDILNVIRDMIDIIHEKHNKTFDISEFRDAAFKSMACKSAIKAGDRVQVETMLHLLMKLRTLEPPLTCPHGRPIIFDLKWNELDKIFKRSHS